MAELNVLKTIKEIRGKINKNYDLKINDIKVIANNSHDQFDLIVNAFIFGYAQGMKACKKEIELKEFKTNHQFDEPLRKEKFSF